MVFKLQTTSRPSPWTDVGCVLIWCCRSSACNLLASSYHSHALTVIITTTITITTDVQGRRHLRSSATTSLIVPPVRRSTLGDRWFPVTAPRAWNSLPPVVRSSSSLITLRRELKTFLYHSSFVNQWFFSLYCTVFHYPLDCVKCPCNVKRDSVT